MWATLALDGLIADKHSILDVCENHGYPFDHWENLNTPFMMENT